MTLQELGQSIREKREAMGISLDDVSSRIKISSRILKSIEEGSLVGLPHAVYTKSFIRAFGLQIGYDQETLKAALEKIFPHETLNDSRTLLAFRECVVMPYPGGAVKRFVMLLAFLLFLCALVGGGWYVAATYGEQVLDMVKKPFSAITAPTEGDIPPQSVGSTSTTRSKAFSRTLQALSGANQQAPVGSIFSKSGRSVPLGGAAPASGAPSSLPSQSPALAGVASSGAEAASSSSPSAGLPGQVNSDMPRDPGMSPPADAFAQSSATGEAAAVADLPRDAASVAAQAPGAPNRLEILADESCWVSYKGDDGRSSHTLQPGERLALTYTTTLELTFGNAGGVTLEHNGKDIGSPGQRGRKAVLRFPETGQ